MHRAVSVNFTALELAKAGAHVIACARTVGGLEDLDDAISAAGGSATLVPFDLNDMNAIDALGGSIFERWGKLDILVANAGVLGTISAGRACRGQGVREGDDHQCHRHLAPDPFDRSADYQVRQGRALILSSGAPTNASRSGGPTPPQRPLLKRSPAPGRQSISACR